MRSWKQIVLNSQRSRNLPCPYSKFLICCIVRKLSAFIVQNLPTEVFDLRHCAEAFSFHCTESSHPASIYFHKVTNRNTRKRCEIYSKLTIKAPERRQWRRSVDFIVSFEHVLVFLLLILNKLRLASNTSELCCNRDLQFNLLTANVSYLIETSKLICTAINWLLYIMWNGITQ